MTASTATSGTIYVVATPIGNLEDISQRAIKTLNAVDSIFAEDTRHTKKLLTALGIQKTLHALHAFNENEKSKVIIERLLQGESIALVSDAGTPLISDPGYPLIKLAHENNIKVSPIPGNCALIAALSVAGLPTDVFTFAGFLPAKQQARIHQLEQLSKLGHTLVIYESTHRIKNCIEDIILVFGETSSLVLAKELTKSFETIKQDSAQNISDWLAEDMSRYKGEFVLVIAPKEKDESQNNATELLKALLEELPLKQAVKIATKVSGSNKNELYQYALELKNK